MLNILKTFLGIRRVEQFPLETIIERTSSFLMPQLTMMEKIEGNKFGFITMESVAYMLNVAQTIGGRTITDNEFEPFFVGVLGEEYRPMVEHRFKTFNNPSFDQDWFAGVVKATGRIAREDVRKGELDRSSFLVATAEDNARWQKTVTTTD